MVRARPKRAPENDDTSRGNQMQTLDHETVDGGCIVTKAEMYFEYLAEEGYRPKIDDEGDVGFKKEGRHYVLFGAEDDPQLFRLGALYLWEIESDEERARALESASEVTGSLKSTKVYIQNDYAHATVELLFCEREDFKPLFPRIIGLLDAGVEHFADGMRNEEEEEPPLALA